MANTTVKGKFNVVAENGDVQTIYPKTTGDQVLVDRSSNASVIPNDVANLQHIVNKMGSLALKSKVETSDFTTGTMISSLEDLKSNTDTGKIADATVVKDIESRVDTLENSNLVTVDELDAGLATKPDTEINDSVTSTFLTWSSKKLSDQITTLNSNIEKAVRVESRVDNIIAHNNDTEGNSELIDIRTDADGTVYESAGAAVREQISDLRNNMAFQMSKNLFDISKAQIGYYYESKATYSDEECCLENPEYTGYKFNVIPGKSYTVSGTSFAYVLYRSDGVRIMSSSSYSTLSNVTIPTTERTAFVTISFKQSKFPLENYMIVEGNSLPSKYVPYGRWIASDNAVDEIFDYEKMTIHRKLTVSNNGSCEFSSVYDAVKYANSKASKKCIYDIYIYDTSTNYKGTSFDIFDEMYGSSLSKLDNAESDFQAGLPLNGYVNLIGVGKVKLLVHLPDNATPAETKAISVLDIFDECYCENLTFEARNCRYAVHDESSGQHPNTKHIFKNCKFVHLGNQTEMWASPAPYGGGTSGACSYEFYNCIFDSTSSGWYAWTTHTKQQALGSNFIFDGCVMLGGRVLSDHNLYSMKFGYNGVSPYNSNSQVYKDCAEHVFLKNVISDGSIKKTWENNNYSCTDNFIIHNFTSVPVISDGDHIV